MVTGRDGKVCAGAGFEPMMASVAAWKAPTISRRRVISASSHATVSLIIVSLFIRLMGSRPRRPPPYPPPQAGEGILIYPPASGGGKGGGRPHSVRGRAADVPP